MSASGDPRVKVPVYSGLYRPSPIFSVRAGDQDAFVWDHPVAAFCGFEASPDEPVTVRVMVPAPIEQARIQPRIRDVAFEVDGPMLTFEAAAGEKFLIRIDKHPKLLLWVDPLDTPPDPAAPDVIYFRGGQVHEIGELHVESGQTVYVEAGAVVRGHVRTIEAEDVTIRGRGVYDGSYGARDAWRAILLDHCRTVTIEGITMIHPPSWNIHLGVSRDIRVENVKQVNDRSGGDGVDVVGSQDVIVRDCLLCNGDDNLVVKAVRSVPGRDRRDFDWADDVRNILFEKCVLLNTRGGSAMEIGYELMCDTVENVTFRDIDVLSVDNHGSVFGIHNSDHATVRNVLWEDVRVEHHYDKLVDFRTLRSRWGRDEAHGRIRDIRLRNIQVWPNRFNPGYTTSQIGGMDAEHDVRGVTFENVRMGDCKVEGPDDLDLFTRHAHDIRFE